VGTYVRHTIGVLRSQGVDVAPLLQRHGISEQALADSKARIPRDNYARFLDDVINNYNIPGFGLLDGSNVNLLDHGILGYAMYSSATFGKAIERHSKYQDLLGAVLRTGLFVDGNTACLRVVDIARPDMVDTEAKLRYNAELLFILWLQHGPAFAAGTRWYRQVHFSFTRPDYVDMYREFFACPVLFDQACNQVLFDAEYLERPLSFANEDAAELCERQCAALLGELTQADGVAGQIRRELGRTPGRFPGIRDMADRLAMSERTLRRRLAAENLSYKRLLLDFRMELARHYLSSRAMTVADVAHLVGYSDTANFHRSFSRQVGQTPAAYRLARQD
jgi:AraC-like DNA-binding protein